jgi:8-oxo-dGTP diphosphatase
MTDSAKGHAPILAAGGIVLRGKLRPRIAVVRLRREKAWVLPKGKLMPREHPRDAAKREVLEETGCDVSVHEFLGSMSYAAEGKIKIVQFWLMRAIGLPGRELMNDVKAVKWLHLRQAIATLSRPHEKVFLTHVGPIALDHAKKFVRGRSRSNRNGGKRGAKSPVPFVEHVIALDYEKTRPSAFAKALANWTSRAAHFPARKVG